MSKPWCSIKLFLLFLESLLRKILREECLPHVEFAYHRVVHSTTHMSSFEIFYGFNPLTPLDLLSLPNISQFKDKSGQVKAGYVKKLHEKVNAQIEKKKIEGYTKYGNKGRKKVTFEPGD